VNSARLLIAGGEYSQTIVHCQHAVEKTLKAALAVRNIIILSPPLLVSEGWALVSASWKRLKNCRHGQKA
jgi:hypothetical protein